MRVKRVARQQYQAIVDRVARRTLFRRPAEGWIRTVRKALGMSGAQLARRLGVTRSRIARAEQEELNGNVTLKSMQSAAGAMGCRFVYAIVPPKTIEDLIAAQARRKAFDLVNAASRHMALEDQAMPKERIAEEIARLTRDIAYEMPSDLWDEK
jgi:predicted DNA-binding mobile mystery protein A